MKGLGLGDLLKLDRKVNRESILIGICVTIALVGAIMMIFMLWWGDKQLDTEIRLRDRLADQKDTIKIYQDCLDNLNDRAIEILDGIGRMEKQIENNRIKLDDQEQRLKDIEKKIVIRNTRRAAAVASVQKGLPAPVYESSDTWNTCLASTYGIGDGLLGRSTATGDILNTTDLTFAARPGYGIGIGQRIEVEYNGVRVVGVRNDSGPFVGKRKIDLAPAMCSVLGFSGVHEIRWRKVK
jgi:rare lipoprotein A (peptidoglycan hydrolase)